jgi:hypothetical protein
MDGHQPQNRDPEVLQLIEFRGYAVEVSLRRERAWKDFVDDCVPYPGLEWAGRFFGDISRLLGDAPRAKGGETQ